MAIRPDAKTVIQTQGIARDFLSGKQVFRVVDSIDFSAKEEEFICILGPSGSGKSTFLKMLGGILDASQGEITFEGKPLGKKIPSSLLRHFGFVFQNDNLLPWRTAEKNLRFNLEVFKLQNQKKYQDRIPEMLEIVGLLDYARAFPHELSGGMRQRVGIARAFVHDPDVVIMDQPMGALDAITRQMLAYEILKIHKQTKKTIIMVTNSVEEALLLSHRIFLFSDLPAKITHEFVVDIPDDLRGPEIVNHKTYQQLRETIGDLIRQSRREDNDEAEK